MAWLGEAELLQCFRELLDLGGPPEGLAASLANHPEGQLAASLLARGLRDNWLGGWVGDMAARRYPDHGRIAVVQFSVLSGVPLSWLLLRVLVLVRKTCIMFWELLKPIPRVLVLGLSLQS